MAATELRRKLAWLIGVRAVIVTLLLGGATVAQITAPGSFRLDPFFSLIALTYGLTIGYAVTLRFVERYRWIIDAEVAADAVIVSAFIYLTGGIGSYFSSLYILPIVAASVVQFRRGGLLAATLCAGTYVGLVLWQYFAAAGWLGEGWIDLSAPALPPRSVAQYTVVLNVFGFFAVALLSGWLAEGVRSAGARLEQASTEIADLQAVNQHVINSLPGGLATADPQQRILTFNDAAEAITGLRLRAVVGRSIADVFQLQGDLVAAMNDGLRRAGTRRLEVRYLTGDGRGEIVLGLGATHLKTPGGHAGFLITFQDVTEIKKLERDVQIQQRLAAVGEMAAGIAHEIRNPLASMSGSIQILRQELPLTPEQEQLMDIVLRESERLNNTIRSFLAYARPQRFAISRFDVRRAINDTALLLRNSSEVRDGHTIDVSVPSDEVRYEADEGQIKQIVWNLATNGLRAMPAGGRLRLSASTDGQGVVIAVGDEGIGMASDELDRLFQPFHGSFEKGSGLGLAIVHRIVADYHGEVRVSSQPGAGTTVLVRLPVHMELLA